MRPFVLKVAALESLDSIRVQEPMVLLMVSGEGFTEKS
jgi:hypothetical protein